MEACKDGAAPKPAAFERGMRGAASLGRAFGPRPAGAGMRPHARRAAERVQVADKSTADSIAVFDHWMRVIGRGVGGVCFVFWALQEAGYIPAAGVPWYASLVWLLLTAYPGAAAVWGRKDPSQWASMCLMAAAAAALLTAGAWLAAVSVLFWAQWLPWIRRQPEDAGPGLAPGLERSSWWQAAALAALGGAGWLLGAAGGDPGRRGGRRRRHSALAAGQPRTGDRGEHRPAPRHSFLERDRPVPFAGG